MVSLAKYGPGRPHNLAMKTIKSIVKSLFARPARRGRPSYGALELYGEYVWSKVRRAA